MADQDTNKINTVNISHNNWKRSFFDFEIIGEALIETFVFLLLVGIGLYVVLSFYSPEHAEMMKKLPDKTLLNIYCIAGIFFWYRNLQAKRYIILNCPYCEESKYIEYKEINRPIYCYECKNSYFIRVI